MLVSELFKQLDADDYAMVATAVFKATGDSSYLDTNQDYDGLVKVGVKATITYPEGYVINNVESFIKKLGISPYDYDLYDTNVLVIYDCRWNWAVDLEGAADSDYDCEVDDIDPLEGCKIYDNTNVVYEPLLDYF